MRIAAFLGIALFVTYRADAQPLAPSDFAPVAPQGFGDRQNSLPWSMVWWPKYRKLYVGTGRATLCTGQAVAQFFRPSLPLYPPHDRDVECTPDFRDLPLQAEIWSWSPDTGAWTRIYRSPNDLPIPGHPDKLVARDIGFRGMHLFTEPDGTEALYVSGLGSRAFNEASPQKYRHEPELPPPRILRSTDGETFAPIPEDPGTIFYDQVPMDGFRGMASYKGRLYVIASVGALGHGNLLESADPARGNDAFRKIQVTPDDHKIFELGTYNGYLYVATGGQPLKGDPPFSVWKTDASGAPPYTFTQVIPPGAFRFGHKTASAISMFEHGGRLYVGTQRELFRINPDDSWDMIVGSPRRTPEGLLAPISGLGDGFSNHLNVHMWRMEGHEGMLYVGTLDLSSKWRDLPGAGHLYGPNMGFDLYATNDGWYFSRVTRTGLSQSGGGGVFDQGVRTLASTPYGLFLGSANPFYGFNLWRAPSRTPTPEAPVRLEAETVGKSVVLSWEQPAGASGFQVMRDATLAPARKIPVEGPFMVENTWVAVDRRGGSTAHNYQVVAEAAPGSLSGPSNLAATPSQAAPVDFANLAARLAGWGAPATWSSQLDSARASIDAGQPGQAREVLANLLAMADKPSAPFPAWRVQDVQALLRKLIRRVILVELELIPAPALAPSAPASRR
jgi:hypothetical protein